MIDLKHYLTKTERGYLVPTEDQITELINLGYLPVIQHRDYIAFNYKDCYFFLFYNSNAFYILNRIATISEYFAIVGKIEKVALDTSFYIYESFQYFKNMLLISDFDIQFLYRNSLDGSLIYLEHHYENFFQCSNFCNYTVRYCIMNFKCQHNVQGICRLHDTCDNEIPLCNSPYECQFQCYNANFSAIINVQNYLKNKLETMEE